MNHITKQDIRRSLRELNHSLEHSGFTLRVEADFAPQYGGWQIKFTEGLKVYMPLSVRILTREAYYYLQGLIFTPFMN